MMLSPLTLFKSPSILTLLVFDIGYIHVTKEGYWLVFDIGYIHVTKGYCFGEEIGIQMIQNSRYFFSVQTQPIESSCSSRCPDSQ